MKAKAKTINGHTLPQFIAFLNETLIPDLKKSGTDATAQDFESAVQWIAEIDGQRRDLLLASVQMLKYVEMTLAHRGALSVEEILKELRHVESISETSTAHHLGCSQTTRNVNLEFVRKVIANNMDGAGGGHAPIDLLAVLRDVTNLAANLLEAVKGHHPIDPATNKRLARARAAIASATP